MRQIPSLPLSAPSHQALNAHTQDILASGDYSAQIQRARQLWDGKSPGTVFDELKSTLSQMCSGIDRCMYCEDSEATDIEHWRPKSLYPAHTFDWENLLYSCSRCNSIKGNRFALLTPTGWQKIAPSQNPASPPAVEPAALLNPRTDNPQDFLTLDFETFYYFPEIEDEGDSRYWRAKYTLELLGLNTHITLVRSRKTAFESFSNILKLYALGHKTEQEAIDEIRKNRFRSVWDAMQRQRHEKALADVAALFVQHPEALDW